ncbi:prolipoprotein diacylglyceryl transferase [Fusobacterium sp. PH5-44]|uniref:prolipoprotein diacylglyceryl transferase n=1 Tax=unclassified Fusobacterium TaxID=2648384 RepID=UPI003D1C0BF3
MIDSHYIPENWGIIKTIFGISSYTFFVFLGIVFGTLYFLYNIRDNKKNKENAAIIFVAALLGSSIGSKLPIIIPNFSLFLENPKFFLSGRSVLGGFIGGLISVIIVKKILKIKGRFGNILAPAAALGIAIGRFGCLLSGCCYGKIGKFGIDYGDGNLRYPTQIFEIFFHLLAFFVLNYQKNKIKKSGILFTFYVITYFIFRFFTEFIRESDIYLFNLTLFQIISVGGIIFVLLKLCFQNNKNIKMEGK